MKGSGDRFWHRSSPVIGAIGGLLMAVTLHTFGPTREPAWLYHTVLKDLFDAAPLVAYLLLIAGGALLGWVFRAFEDRYIYD